MPARYSLKLSVAGKDLVAPLDVKIEPDISVSQEDLAKQFDLAKRISDRITQAHETVNSIRTIHTELQALQTQISAVPGDQELLGNVKSLDQKMLAVEDALYQMNKTAEKDSFNYGGRLNDMFIALQSAVERGDDAPTQQTFDVFDYLDHELQQQLSEWNKMVSSDLPALNKMIRDKSVPFVGATAKTVAGN